MTVSTLTVEPDGPRRWVSPDGDLHRENGPAYQHESVSAWHYHGKLHRVDGPAVTKPDGKEEWWLHGERHRTDGPAVLHEDGSTEWYLHGAKHRTDGPAVNKTGSHLRLWYVNGYMVDTETKPDVPRPTQKGQNISAVPDSTWDAVNFNVFSNTQREHAINTIKNNLDVALLNHTNEYVVAVAAWHLPADDDYVAAALTNPFVHNIMRYRTDVPEHIRTLMKVAA